MSKRILKNILLKELTEAGEQYNPEDNIETPFERDPMGFILKKYTTLNDILTELMSESFKEYLDAIFIVAPKPTTFKVMLHNGQFFFLTFTGKAYQATVQGKDYYLMTIGEKERCMQAIARMLRYGSPLKTKGPEGAEQSTRPEGEEGGGTAGGGENTGMEGDWAEKTGNAVPAEGGEEEEETVSESTILENMLKKSVYREAKTDSSTYSAIFNALEKNNLSPKRKTDGKLHIRTSFDEEKPVLQDILKSAGLSTSDYTIKVIDPSKSGSLSGSFKTYEISILKDKGDIKKDKVYVVNTRKTSKTGVKTTITQKSLTPTNLGLNGMEYKSAEQLVQASKNAIKNNPVRDFLDLLIDDVYKGAPSSGKSLSEIKSFKQDIKYSKNTEDAAKSASKSDLAIIGKDFGEVLGGIFLAKLVGVKDQIEFPSGNEPLVDFYIDEYKISSKYDKGAAASITDLVRDIDPKRIKDKNELDFYNTMKNYITNSGPQAYINVAASQQDKMPAIKVLASILKVDTKDITPQNINDYITKLVDKKTPKDKTREIYAKFGKFFKAADSAPSELKWQDIKPKQYYGIITSPLSYYIVKRLNENKDYLVYLKKLVARTEVKQMYLKFEPKSSSMTFNIKSFNDPSATFQFKVPSISVYNPTASKLGFKMNI